MQYVDDDTLLVAISEPSNVLAVDDIALMTGLNVRAALTTEEQLEELLSRLSQSDVERATQGRRARVSATGRRRSGRDRGRSRIGEPARIGPDQRTAPTRLGHPP